MRGLDICFRRLLHLCTCSGGFALPQSQHVRAFDLRARLHVRMHDTASEIGEFCCSIGVYFAGQRPRIVTGCVSDNALHNSPHDFQRVSR
jgi:hypothetical protein